ncbi:hypothetical protein Q8F57_027190 [Paraburkholderia terrae]|uniref:hypothetical protein n=1 Tax=Paraburkholderia terrae TaxID=311230 RepID=UPI00296B29B9|nr:hypothetical protein [Paraburkholderia terrae]MDW3660303.1 hypothetical protein [Paraburkholderia terrae]
MKAKRCPYINKPCIEHECTMWTHIQGKHPQSGAEQDMWDCSIKWLPILMIENSREVRHTAAAMESARNEITQRQDLLNNAVTLARSNQRIEPPEAPKIAS